MKIPKLKKWESIRITWLDSYHESGWKPSQDWEEEHAESWLSHQSQGFVLFETEKAIALVQSISTPFHDVPEHRSVDALMVIPKCSITKVERL